MPAVDTLIMLRPTDSPTLFLQQLGRGLRPRIEQAIIRSIGRAQISKVDYDTPTRGSVRAKLSLNLEDLWREMNSQ